MTERSLSKAELYGVVPTIRVDGRADDVVAELITGMRMTEREGGLSALELRLDNLVARAQGSADLAFEDERTLHLGAAIVVLAGDESAPQEIFRGLVTGLLATFSDAAAPEIVVLAEDALQRARMARRTAVHDDLRIGDLASRIAGRLGLRPVVTGYSGSVGRQVQHDESDLAFLRRLLSCYDGEVQVVGGELHVSPRGDAQRGVLELELYSQLRRAQITADLAHQATEVRVGGWNAGEGRQVEGSSKGKSLGPGAGRAGAALLRRAIGERVELLGDLSAASAAEAAAIADAAFDRRARRFVCVEGTALGNPALRVGTHVALRGISRRFDNTYHVVRACHRFDRTRGYETDFEAECAFLGDP